MNWEYHPEAELELVEAALHYEAEVGGLGARFADEVQRVLELILEDPGMGVRVDGEIRHFLLMRFPFSVMYALRADTLSILVTALGSRKPGYWRSRLGA